jgi:hypothetical protein
MKTGLCFQWESDGRLLALISFCCAACCLSSGCQGPGPVRKQPDHGGTNAVAAVRPADFQLAGKVIRVNPEFGYIVAECAVLPNSGEEARLLRGEFEVGRIRFSGPYAFPYAIADVIEGRPVAGDRIRK